MVRVRVLAWLVLSCMVWFGRVALPCLVLFCVALSCVLTCVLCCVVVVLCVVLSCVAKAIFAET
jgi:hypothetical protein